MFNKIEDKVMTVHRGLGIWAPIIFALVYLTIFGICNIVADPQLGSGWFIYIGTVSAALATWFSGVRINRKVYQARRKNPLQQAHTHSLLFIPMEYWAIPLTFIALVVGGFNNSKIKQEARQEKQRMVNAEKNFYEQVKVKDDFIINPSLNDYYKMSFQSENNDSRTGIEREHTYYIPVKVISFNDDQIQFYCPLTYTYEADRDISNRQKYFKTFYHSGEEGYSAWTDKSALRRALPRDFNEQDNSPQVLMPALIGEDPLRILDIWRIDGPDLAREDGYFESPSKISLKLRNTGLPFLFNKIQYQGNKIYFTKEDQYDLSMQDFKHDEPGTLVAANEQFIIFGDFTNSNSESHIEFFVEDLEKRKFKFEIKNEYPKITIERVAEEF